MPSLSITEKSKLVQALLRTFPPLALQFGLVPGIFSSTVIGSNPDVDFSTVPETVWDQGGLYSYPTVPVQLEVWSDSWEDMEGEGMGAWVVRIYGLDINFDPVWEDVPVFGLDPMPTWRTDWRRVFGAYVLDSGIMETNDGTIWINIIWGGTILAHMQPGFGQTHSGLVTVRKDHVAAIETIGASYNGDSLWGENEIKLGLFTREIWGWRQRFPFSLRDSGTGTFSLRLPRPIIVPDRTDIEIRVLSIDATEGKIAAWFDLTEVNLSVVSIP